MDKYAIIQLGGKQMMVTEGIIFEIERQKDVTPEVLLFSDGSSILLGQPILDNVEVKATVVEEKLDDKVIVARFKSKSRYRKKKGHRQPLSVIKIESINVKSTSSTKKKEAKEESK